MNARTRWTLGIGPLIVVGVALLLAACGGSGGSYEPAPFGELEIYNDFDSIAAIVDIEIAESFGPYYAYYADQYVLRDESWFVDLYPTTYDVTLFWSDSFVETYTVDIYDGLTTTIFAFR